MASTLEAGVGAALDLFVSAARTAFGDDLISIVLFGSAAEGRLRVTSDVNVIVVLSAFNAAKGAAMREPFAAVRAAVKLRPMYLLRSEVGEAAQAFAQKFADVRRRRRVLFGEDPFVALAVSRPAEIFRLRQVLLNLTLRLRAAYVAAARTDDRLALTVAEVAGPLRSCAATLLELEGRPADSPKEALDRIATALLPDAEDVLGKVSSARATGALPTDMAAALLLRLADLAAAMRDRAGTTL
jgi:predicted nucleotidyltransferase